MTAAVESPTGAPRVAFGTPATRWPTRLAIVAIVAVTVSPIVVAAVSLMADRWYPVGDLSHIWFRVGQVGTRQTPLVGAETIKGWAHPGPMEFWLAAPLYRLTGGDPRSLFVTAAAVNVTAIAGIAAVAWRRGRFPLLVGTMLVSALLIHAWTPPTVVSIWNPFLPLFPFLLVVVLAWDVALGQRRSVLWLAVVATVAAQVHFAFLILSSLIVASLVGGCWAWRRLAGRGVVTESDEWEGGEPPAPPWEPWARAVRRAVVVAAVLWLPVAFDLVFDLHNPINIAKAVAQRPDSVGPVGALGLVGRYVRPDGPWLGGAEPVAALSVQGSGPLPLVVALAVVGGCLYLGWRRRLLDVVALAALALALVVGALPATSQVYVPVYIYLTQFLKVVGVVVWATAAWTAWRLAAGWLASGRNRRRGAGALAIAGLVGAAAWSWGTAANVTTPNPAEERAVQSIRHQLADALPDEGTLRVEFVGDYFNISGAGVIAWLIHDGRDVLTSDGGHGLKWGHDHRYRRGEEYDQRITVAVTHLTSWHDPIRECERQPGARLVAEYDPLTPAQREWVTDVRLRRLDGRDAVSDAEVDRLDRLGELGPRISVFEGPRQCARTPRDT